MFIQITPMKLKTTLLAALLTFGQAVVMAQPSTAARPQGKGPVLEVSRSSPGTVRLELGPGIVLNSGSTLKTEAYVLNDPDSPIRIEGEAPVKVVYRSSSRSSSGGYEYSGYLDLKAREPVVALEYKAHVFDVFGRPVRTLVGTEVTDITGPKVLAPSWRIFSENEASEHQVSVIYISLARTASGTVYRIDRNKVLEAVQKISAQVSAADLEPPKRKTEP